MSNSPLTYRDNLIIIKRFIRLQKHPSQWASFLFNKFEKTVFKRVPELKQLKHQLIAEGAENACLSGSGSALYGIVHSQEQGESIKKRIKKFRGTIWVVHSV
jgi:4-diphosphocytidyl-2C-methyl-D-erythritol kinase